jgi:hypothetical protein
VPGLILLGLGWSLASAAPLIAGAVLVAHVDMDRLLGCGLKYPPAFADTHLGRIGRIGR